MDGLRAERLTHNGRRDETMKQNTAGALYAIAARRMAAAGSEMPCSAAVFTVLSQAEPEQVRYPLLAGLENADFLEAAFLLLLERPVDAETRAAWSRRYDLPRPQFQTAVLRSVLHSQEYTAHMFSRPLTGCPLPLTDANAGVRVQVAAQPMPERLLRIYRRMPGPMKRLAKKLAGKE